MYNKHDRHSSGHNEDTKLRRGGNNGLHRQTVHLYKRHAVYTPTSLLCGLRGNTVMYH